MESVNLRTGTLGQNHTDKKSLNNLIKRMKRQIYAIRNENGGKKDPRKIKIIVTK